MKTFIEVPRTKFIAQDASLTLCVFNDENWNLKKQTKLNVYRLDSHFIGLFTLNLLTL